MMYLDFLDYQIADLNNKNLDHCIETLQQSGYASHLCCLNPHSYVIAKTDVEFQNALKESCLLVKKTWLETGKNVSLVARRLGLSRTTVYKHIKNM